MGVLETSLATIVLSLMLSPPWDGSPSPPAPLEREPDYSKRDPKVVRANAAKVAQLVKALDAIEELSKDRIEAATGVLLGSPKEEPGGFGLAYEGKFESGPFLHIGFRHSKPDAPFKWSVVSLGVRPLVVLRKTDFAPGVLGDRLGFNVHDGRDGSHGYGFDGPGKKATFVFQGRTGRFMRASLLRGTAASKGK
jgi:hypothetical protein